MNDSNVLNKSSEEKEKNDDFLNEINVQLEDKKSGDDVGSESLESDVEEYNKNDVVIRINAYLYYRNSTFNEELNKMYYFSHYQKCEVKIEKEKWQKGVFVINKNFISVYGEFNIGNEGKDDVDIEKSMPDSVRNFPIFTLNIDLVSFNLRVSKSSHQLKLIILGKNYKLKSTEINSTFTVRVKLLEEKSTDDFNKGKNDGNIEKTAVSSLNYKVAQQNCSSSFQLLILKLSTLLSNSKSSKLNLLGVSLVPKFHLNFFISVAEFKKRVKSADILLFRGFDKNSGLQRCLTRAEYDHVAIVMRRGEEISIYEATGKEGVKLRNWNMFRTFSWNLLYEKMVLRELIIDETIIKSSETNKKLLSNSTKKYSMSVLTTNFYEDLNKKLLDYIKATQGLKYSLRGCNLCWGETAGNEKINKKTTYFCSSLVARAYKELGIIPSNIKVGSFFPGTFSKYSEIAFNKGYKLGPEYVIDFTSE